MITARSEKNLATVVPELATRVRRLLNKMAQYGYPMVVTDGNRTLEQQQALYAQGRTAPGKIVTYADGVKAKSNHQGGRAVDCTFLNEKGSAYYPSDENLWELYGKTAESVGLNWGGRWAGKKKDRPHIELPADKRA